LIARLASVHFLKEGNRAELPAISVAGLRMGQKYGEEFATEIMQGK